MNYKNLMCDVDLFIDLDRQSGNTTRQADYYIQKLFKDYHIEVKDHHGTRYSNERLYKIILERLHLEHGKYMHFIIPKKENLTISFNKEFQNLKNKTMKKPYPDLLNEVDGVCNELELQKFFENVNNNTPKVIFSVLKPTENLKEDTNIENYLKNNPNTSLQFIDSYYEEDVDIPKRKLLNYIGSEGYSWVKYYEDDIYLIKINEADTMGGGSNIITRFKKYKIIDINN